MAWTLTGSFPIGFRRGWEAWQRDLPQLIEFARANDFAFLDFGPAPVEELRQVQSAGVQIGSVDLKDWKDLVSPDAGKRRATVAANIDYAKAVLALGVTRFLTVIVPEDPARKRTENFEFAVDSYGQLAEAIASAGAKIVVEGWPGAAPHFGSIACTPADCRAFFSAAGSDALGVNYDPSHLVRMGIDPVRFAREFASRIFHAHAKDTALSDEKLYEYGNLQPATFAKPHGFGGHHWRYALPGHGQVPWAGVLGALHGAGYKGLLSIELEDEQVNGSREAEQRGLIAAREYLAGV